MTEQMFLHDAYRTTAPATVTEVVELHPSESDRPGTAATTGVITDRTIFYATSGGQPHDTGTLGGAAVVDVRKTEQPDGSIAIVHHLAGGPVPAVGDEVELAIDWDRRHRLMRTHTAVHIMGAIVVGGFDAPVTGGNMEPLSGRLDFELATPPDGFKEQLQSAIDAELTIDRPIAVSFIPRDEAVLDASLIRTKVSLVPESVREVRVVDIVGLDRQADGGTHVRSTGEVGRIVVGKIQSKGKGFRRVRIDVVDAP